MGGWNFSAKLEAERLPKVEIWWLKKHGYLEGFKSGVIQTEASWCCAPIRFNISVVNLQFEKYAIFRYLVTADGEKPIEYEYRVQLATTPCNYGGARYWFECKFCCRNVGVLYLSPKNNYFLCRHCNNLTYSSRNSKYGSITSMDELAFLREQIKRTHYRGKVTRKYWSYLNKQAKVNRVLVRLS